MMRASWECWRVECVSGNGHGLCVEQCSRGEQASSMPVFGVPSVFYISNVSNVQHGCGPMLVEPQASIEHTWKTTYSGKPCWHRL